MKFIVREIKLCVAKIVAEDNDAPPVSPYLVEGEEYDKVGMQ